MQQQPDPPVAYATVLPGHNCQDCGSPHHLRPHPDPEGWSVVVACTKCRDKVGLGRRYSTEIRELRSLEEAERRIKRMLAVTTSTPPSTKNIFEVRPGNFRVCFSRDGKQFRVGSFNNLADAVTARDAFLDAA